MHKISDKTVLEIKTTTPDGIVVSVFIRRNRKHLTWEVDCPAGSVVDANTKKLVDKPSVKPDNTAITK